MIQRIQSIYLLVGLVIGIGSWVLDYSLPSNLLQIGWASTILILLVTILSYKNRRLQVFLSIIAGLTFLISQIYKTVVLEIEIDPLWTGIGTLLYYIFLALAIKNIQKDNKLVSDTSRLR